VSITLNSDGSAGADHLLAARVRDIEHAVLYGHVAVNVRAVHWPRDVQRRVGMDVAELIVQELRVARIQVEVERRLAPIADGDCAANAYRAKCSAGDRVNVHGVLLHAYRAVDMLEVRAGFHDPEVHVGQA